MPDLSRLTDGKCKVESLVLLSQKYRRDASVPSHESRHHPTPHVRVLLVGHGGNCSSEVEKLKYAKDSSLVRGARIVGTKGLAAQILEKCCSIARIFRF